MSVLNDLSAVTQIPIELLDRLNSVEELCCCHKFFEDICDKNPITELDIGLGKIYMESDGEKISYKFIPSKSFEKQLIKTIKLRQSPLVLKSQEALKNKIMNAYKELL